MHRLVLVKFLETLKGERTPTQLADAIMGRFVVIESHETYPTPAEPAPITTHVSGLTGTTFNLFLSHKFKRNPKRPGVPLERARCLECGEGIERHAKN